MPDLQLNVAVVGGGIAGLTTALALRRHGHVVTVVESSSWLREAGAAVGIPPNASRVLTELGLDLKEDVKVAVLRSTKAYSFTKTDHPPKFGDNGDGHHVPWANRLKALGLLDFFYFGHRVDVHDAIKNKCVSADGSGTPVKVILASRVLAFDPSGTIKLHDGQQMHADLVIAADGIRSTAPEIVLGRKAPAIPSGITTMRFLLKTKNILEDPEIASLMEDGPGCFCIYSHAESKTNVLRYPCHNDELQNFAVYAFTGNTQTLDGEQVSRADLVKRLSSMPDIIQATGKRSEDSVYDWKIADREPIPTYHKDRLVLVGDAAHPMWPRQGQGAAQAIEDAATLGVLMSGLQDRVDVPKRLDLYDQLRVNRTSIIQRLSRLREAYAEAQVRTDDKDPLPDEIVSIFERFFPEFVPNDYGQFSRWLWAHDCTREAETLLSSEMSKETLTTLRYCSECLPTI